MFLRTAFFIQLLKEMRNTSSSIWKTVAWVSCSEWLFIFRLKFKIRQNQRKESNICRFYFVIVNKPFRLFPKADYRSRHPRLLFVYLYPKSCKRNMHSRFNLSWLNKHKNIRHDNCFGTSE